MIEKETESCETREWLMLRFGDSTNIQRVFLHKMCEPLKKYGLFIKAVYLAGISSLLFACATTPEEAATTATPAPIPVEARPLPDGSLFELLLAETAARRGWYDQALALFANQAEITQSISLAQTTARLADHLQAYDAGQNALALWLAETPSDTRALDLKARALIHQNKPLEAFELIYENDDLAQQKLYSLLAITTTKTHSEQLPELTQRVEAKVNNRPNDISLLLCLGLLQNATDSDKAIEALEKAKNLAPKNTTVISVLASLLAQTDRLDEATELLKYGLNTHPMHFGMKRQLARIMAQTDIVSARNIYKDLYETAPNDSETLYMLSQISLKLAFYKEAKQYLNLLEKNPSHSDFAHYNLGLIAEHSGEQFIALNHYDQIDNGPYLLPSLSRYGKLAAQLSGIDAYEQRLASLKTNNPDKALALTGYHIEYLLGLGRNDRAKALVESGLKTYGNDSKLLYGQFLIAERSEDYQQATQSLREILQQQPDNPVILNALGYILSRYLQRHEEAKPLITQALSLKPNDAEIIDSMGFVLLQLGNIQEATKYLMRAYTKSTAPDIAAHLGEALWLSNQGDQAIDVWLEAFKIDANNAELKAVLRRLNIELPAL